jgi:predicted metal-binding protein
VEEMLNDLVKEALELNATRAAVIEVTKIPFNQDFRKQCEQNVCGSYNKNWMCPPAVGSISDLIQRVMDFKHGLLLQTVHQLEDSYDWEGMLEGLTNHDKVFRKLLERLKSRNILTEILPLSAGHCLHCAECAYITGKECYFPEKAISSVEAHGIDVMDLLKGCGIPYANGQNTVSYVGLILFKEAAK